MSNWRPLGVCCFYPALWPCVLSLPLGWLLFWMGRKCSWWVVCGSDVNKVKVKGKAIPITGLDRPWGGLGCQILRQSAYGKLVSSTHRPPLPSPPASGKYSWYSFLLEAESTPGPQCGRKDYVNENFRWHHRGSSPRPSGLQRSSSTNFTTVCSTKYISILY